VETAEAGGELRDLLSTVLYCAMFMFFFFEQWRMQKTKEKEKEQEQWLAVKTEEAGGELLSTVHMQRE
jgi:preprotein translocase subunit YajC